MPKKRAFASVTTGFVPFRLAQIEAPDGLTCCSMSCRGSLTGSARLRHTGPDLPQLTLIIGRQSGVVALPPAPQARRVLRSNRSHDAPCRRAETCKPTALG